MGGFPDVLSWFNFKLTSPTVDGGDRFQIAGNQEPVPPAVAKNSEPAPQPAATPDVNQQVSSPTTETPVGTEPVSEVKAQPVQQPEFTEYTVQKDESIWSLWSKQPHGDFNEFRKNFVNDNASAVMPQSDDWIYEGTKVRIRNVAGATGNDPRSS